MDGRRCASTICATPSSHLIVDLGLDVAHVSHILGHANITVTLDVYTHLFDDASYGHEIRQRMAASQFAGLLNFNREGPGAALLQLPSARSV